MSDVELDQVSERAAKRYAKLRQQFERAEADLVRATRKWDRLRVRVRRAELAADKAFNARAGAGGKLDWTAIDGKPLAHCSTGAPGLAMCGAQDATYLFSRARFEAEVAAGSLMLQLCPDCKRALRAAALE